MNRAAKEPVNRSRFKYPRTPHLPWSPGATNDDRVLSDVDHFTGREVVVSHKLDGENASLYSDFLHARSLDSGDHPSRHYLKGFHASIKHLIPQGWRVCGENLYARHSIAYPSLPAYFIAFSVWNADNRCLDVDETEALLSEWGIQFVPIIYRGMFDVECVKECLTGLPIYGGEQEGYVVRLADGFQYDDFDRSVAKFVRANHVTTDSRWVNEAVVPNGLLVDR